MMSGIYVHIPFCRKKCDYCSFYSVAYDRPLAARYLRALASEIGRFEGGFTPTSVYIGGGTPTVLGADALAGLVSAVKGRFPTPDGAEITVEANPGTLSGFDLGALLSAGVNRVSLGAQSFDPAQLRRLGRAHTPADVRDSLSLLRRAGFNNVGLDLIYGLPGQDMDGWAVSLGEAVSARPEHVSVYALSVDEGTPFYQMQRRGRLRLPSETVQAGMYVRAVETLEEAGYVRYEFSNFALPGRECRHNAGYWSGSEYLGFGAAAHSHVRGVRTANVASVSGYIDAVENGRSPAASSETLSAGELETEFVMLGLRRPGGVSLAEYSARFGRDLEAERAESIDRLARAGYLERSEGRLRLTLSGVLASNSVIAELLE